MTRFLALVLIGGVTPVFAQGLPARRYQNGEKLTYKMKTVNEGRNYEIRATGIVKRDSTGKHIEEYVWSDLFRNGSRVELPASGNHFRQVLSLDPDIVPALPNLAEAPLMLIGPITDFMTFYADLWLAIKSGKLTHPGDHFYQSHGTPASWADGNRVVLGETSIDFDISYANADLSNEVATLMVRHVPPKQPQVRLPAAWMREPVAGTPNNWVQVTKRDGKYLAAVGKETFDVELKLSLIDGKILSGTMVNPVRAQERECSDPALTACGDSRPRDILRKIEISLER
ncbi:MAG: hypothetical protein WD696_20425 [Bryobacteraceae bacterium]